jgi:LssY-like putative type I secretion system component LssY
VKRVALLFLLAPAAASQGISFPAGSVIPIRFLHAVTSGRDTVGTPVVAQTFAAMVSDSCVVVPPFALISGRVMRSVGGRRLGRSGRLGVVFDTLEVDPGVRVAIHAVLDTLEYTRSGQVRDSGVVYARTSRLPIAIGAAASAVDIVPAALFGGFLLARRGARASILTGEVGAVRLLAPLAVPAPPTCSPVAVHRDLHEVPALPRFEPHASDKGGHKSGDPINLIFLGPGRQLDSAFRRAGWVAARPASLWALTREATAAITSRPAVGAPVSTLYFEGRKEDLAYELAGPNARIRDHVRIWLLDSLAGVWVGAGTKDIGLRVRPLRVRATHRIDPNVDHERDLITSTLESVGCADLLDYLTLPGADTVGHTIDGQRFHTDARSAVLRLNACPQTPSSP